MILESGNFLNLLNSNSNLKDLNSNWRRFQKFELNLEQVREFEFESGAGTDFGKPN